MKIIRNGNAFMPDGRLLKMNVVLENGKIKALTEDSPAECDEIVDADNCIVSPGFVDIHIHGANGSDFSDGTQEAVDNIAGYLLKQGVTAFLGTTMSLGEQQLSQIMEAAAPFIGVTRSSKAVLWGINMEGPFIAQGKKGGQNKEYIINPDFDFLTRLFKKSNNSIRLVDIAPELDGGLEFIEKAKELCNVSLAHTEAGYDLAKQAFSRGAKHVTHLFNAMSPLNHREPGVIAAAAEDAGHVEIICDGIHLHPAIIRLAFKMFGNERICIVSDSMRACGMADGEYMLGGQAVILKKGCATLNDGTLAGSTTSVPDAFRQAVDFGISIESALRAVTCNPAKAAGLENIIGSLKPGNRADIVIFDDKLSLRTVLLEGINHYL